MTFTFNGINYNCKSSAAIHAMAAVQRLNNKLFNSSFESEEEKELYLEALDVSSSYFGKFDKHDLFEIKKTFDGILFDINHKNFSDTTEFYLMDYDTFYQDFFLTELDCRSEEYQQGFFDVFDKLESNEQREFIFHQYLKLSDRFKSNNYFDYQEAGTSDRKHIAGCVFWILEVIES